MDLLSPLRHGVDLAFKGVGVASNAVKLATAVPGLVKHQISGNGHGTTEQQDRPQPSTTTPAAAPSSPAAGGTGARQRTARATPGRTGVQDGAVGQTKSPPEPTSAAGASGGVAGTSLAPGDAAAAGAPDPTTGTTPRGNRRTNDTAPPRARRRQASTPKRSQIDRRRAAEREADPAAEAVETEGAASPGAQIHVDEPWPNYGKMKAPDIVDRVRSSDAAVKAVVRLYEQTHKKRKSIIDATG